MEEEMRGGERGRGGRGRGRGREGVAQGPAHAKAGSVCELLIILFSTLFHIVNMCV